MILENNRKKVIIFRIILGIIVFAILISAFVYFKITNKKNDSSSNNNQLSVEEGNKNNENEETIFKIDNILLYSSANALNNSETQKDYWNLNIYQYTDMSITINNHVYSDKLTSKNLVSKMYIDNVNFSVKPTLGTPGLFYKNPNSIGMPIVDDLDNQITDRLDFTVDSINSTVDYSKPSFYADCSNPLTLSYVNSNVYSSLIIKNNASSVTFDGSLLQKSGTKLSNIQATVNFTIHIENAIAEEYVCDVEIPIPLEDESQSILDGHYVTELTNLEEYKFTKVIK